MNIASGKPSRVVEVAQQFAFYGLASNLIMYLTDVLDQPLAAAAKNVNTWLGVSSVFPVLGAFLADSYLGRFKTIVFSITIYFLVNYMTVIAFFFQLICFHLVSSSSSDPVWKPDHPIVNFGTCLTSFLIAEFWAPYGYFIVSARTNTTFTITAPSKSTANKTALPFQWPSHLTFEEIPAYWIYYWVQMHVTVVDDPFACPNGVRDFPRVRLKVVAGKPLSNGFWLQRRDGGRTRVMFKYECLSNFCFLCKRLVGVENAETPPQMRARVSLGYENPYIEIAVGGASATVIFTRTHREVFEGRHFLSLSLSPTEPYVPSSQDQCQVWLPIINPQPPTPAFFFKNLNATPVTEVRSLLGPIISIITQSLLLGNLGKPPLDPMPVGNAQKREGMVLLTLSVSIIPPQSGRVVFFVALYILSVAEGGQKPCVQTFAADQFDENTPEEIKVKSSFFNWWYLGVVFGATSATLGVVYLQDNIGWGLGFGILAGVLVVSLVSFLLGTKRYRKQMPPGSPFTMVVQVLVAAARKWHVNKALNSECVYYGDEGEALLQGQSQPLVVARANQLRCLDKAMIIDELDASTIPRNPWRLCSLNQVEEVKLVLRLIPLWLSCLMFGVIEAQLHTFFTKQSSTTIRSISPHFQVPAASLQGLVGIAILIAVPIYDRFFVPIARKYTGHPSGITVLQRIGIGLALSILVMVVSALVEAKRLNIAKDYNLIDKPKAIVPMRVWWLLPQYLILGLANAFTTVGLQELFYDQMPEQMRSMGAAASMSVVGVGSFISNWIISVAELITSRKGDKWLGDNINRAHLDYFYWVLAVLSTLNLCVYVLIANAFVYKKVGREVKVKTDLSFANNHGGEI
ncbi:unnamed protein product [Malus baccata var. baccata]